MKIKSTVAQCATLIRNELKTSFPKTKFKVTSSSYSMGDSVNVSWTDGAAQNQVEKILEKYQYGSLNGMEDIYEYTNDRYDIAQTKYLFCERKVSDEIYLAKFEELKQNCDILKEITDINAKNKDLFACWDCWTARQFIYRTADGFREIDFTNQGSNPIY